MECLLPIVTLRRQRATLKIDSSPATDHVDGPNITDSLISWVRFPLSCNGQAHDKSREQRRVHTEGLTSLLLSTHI
jgi:hypothetical protein